MSSALQTTEGFDPVFRFVEGRPGESSTNGTPFGKWFEVPWVWAVVPPWCTFPVESPCHSRSDFGRSERYLHLFGRNFSKDGDRKLSKPLPGMWSRLYGNLKLIKQYVEITDFVTFYYVIGRTKESKCVGI